MSNGLEDLKRQRAQRTSRQAPPPRNPKSKAAPPPREVTEVQPPATVEIPQPTPPADASVDLPQLTLAKLADWMPSPSEPASEAAELLPTERGTLERCEELLETADLAFWVQGRMLETVLKGKLYREQYSSFAEYLRHERQLKPRRAYQLIEAWALADHLVKKLSALGVKPTLKEDQVRTLLKFSEHHGFDAAVTVYRLVGEKGPRVTSTALQAVISKLPEDQFDETIAERVITEHFAAPTSDGEAKHGIVHPAPKGDEDVTQSTQAVLARAFKLARDRDSANRVADELEKAAARLRQQFQEDVE